jgi:hypothetical protein
VRVAGDGVDVFRRVGGTKLNGLAEPISVVNLTAGGLIELAKSELDDAMLT